MGSCTNIAETLFEPLRRPCRVDTDTGTTETRGVSGSSSPASR